MPHTFVENYPSCPDLFIVLPYQCFTFSMYNLFNVLPFQCFTSSMFYLFNGFVDHSKRPGAIGQPAAC